MLINPLCYVCTSRIHKILNQITHGEEERGEGGGGLADCPVSSKRLKIMTSVMPQQASSTEP